MLDMVGWPDAQKRGDEIVALETRIADASWSRAESREQDKTYNPLTPAELDAYAPGFSWSTFLAAAQVGGADRVVVRQLTAFPKLARIFAETPLGTLQAWEAFRIADFRQDDSLAAREPDSGRRRYADRGSAFERRDGVDRPAKAPNSLSPVKAAGDLEGIGSSRLGRLVSEQNRSRVLFTRGEQHDALASLREAERTRVDDAVSPGVAASVELVGEVTHRVSAIQPTGDSPGEEARK